MSNVTLHPRFKPRLLQDLDANKAAVRTEFAGVIRAFECNGISLNSPYRDIMLEALAIATALDEAMTEPVPTVEGIGLARRRLSAFGDRLTSLREGLLRAEGEAPAAAEPHDLAGATEPPAE